MGVQASQTVAHTLTLVGQTWDGDINQYLENSTEGLESWHKICLLQNLAESF